MSESWQGNFGLSTPGKNTAKPRFYVPKKDPRLYSPEQLALRGIPSDYSCEKIDEEYDTREILVKEVDVVLQQILRHPHVFMRYEGLPSISDPLVEPTKFTVEVWQKSGLVKKAVNLGIVSQRPTPGIFLGLERSHIGDVLTERIQKPPFNGNQLLASMALSFLSIVSVDQFYKDRSQQ